MPEHLIFDYFTPAPESELSQPDQAAYAGRAGAPPMPVGAGAPPPTWAQAAASIGSPPSAAYQPSMASSPHPPGYRPPNGPGSPPQRPGPYPPGQYPPQQYPQQQYPQQGQRPPGQRPQGRPSGPPPGYGPPPTQPYGGRGGPGGPGGYPPGPGGMGSGGSGSRRLILIIAGVVVLVAAAIGVGYLVTRPDNPVATPSPTTVVGSTSPTPTPAETGSPTASPSASPNASPSASASSTSTTSPNVQALPKAAAIPESVVIVPMRRGGGSNRPLYLVDSEGKIARVKLASPEGLNSNPMMQESRDTIIYLHDGEMRVMGTDGSGDRKLFDRDPAGCKKILHASWSLVDPNVMLISCQVSKTKQTFLVIDLNGRLIRRLDIGKKVIGDFGISPDGQTVLYWASDNPNLDGGSLFTLPLIGTGSPKQLTDSADGEDADPAWSPDSTMIAFRRTIPDGTERGDENVYVMNSDGSGERPVAETPARDFKPIWSPDNKNLLIISNRKSAFGGPGKTYDLWLTRVSDKEVLDPLGLKAKQITRPFWTLR